MDSGKAIMMVTSTVMLLSAIGMVTVTAKPMEWSDNPQPQNQPHYELHPIDNCIFACDHCFKGDALVKCANECILSEASMGSEWTSICPFLSRQYTHPVGPPFFPHNTNPYRH